jgi:LysM repeat protein
VATSSASSSSSVASSSTASSSSSNSQYLVVRSGDDFGAIAARYGISSDKVATLNPGVDSTQLTIGQSLRVH